MLLSALIDRYIADMDGVDGLPGLKPLGESHRCTLRVIQKMPVGDKPAAKLTKIDIIEMCKALRKKVGAATAGQYVTYLRGALTYAGAAWEGCEDISPAPIAAAKALLVKYQLIGKSKPRDRRPTEDELARLRDYFLQQDAEKRTRIKMWPIVEFSLWSGRRIGETCRLRWGDVNGADMTCIVRDMKDPRHKKGNDHEFPLLGRAWDIVMAQPRLTDDPNERIFPYNSESCSKRYIDAKKKLGIKNLRLHDNRAETASRLLEGYHGGQKYTIPETMVVTGHKTPHILMRTYARLKAKNVPKIPTTTKPAEPAKEQPAAESSR